MHTPKSAMTLNEDIIQFRQQVKVQEKRDTATKEREQLLQNTSCNSSGIL